MTEARRALRETQQHVREVQRTRDDLVAVQARLAADHATLTKQLTVADAARQPLVAEERALRHALAERGGQVQRLQARLMVQAAFMATCSGVLMG